MKKLTVISLVIVAIAMTCVTLMSLKKTSSPNSNEIVKSVSQNGFSAFAMEDANSF